MSDNFATERFAVAANLENLIPAMKETVNLLREGQTMPAELHALLYMLRTTYTREVLDKAVNLGYGLPSGALRRQADALIKDQAHG